MKRNLADRLGERLKELRWTQTTLAEVSGVSQSAVNRLLADKYDDPGVMTTERLCAALGLTLRWALEEKGPRLRPGAPVPGASTDRRKRRGASSSGEYQSVGAIRVDHVGGAAPTKKPSKTKR